VDGHFISAGFATAAIENGCGMGIPAESDRGLSHRIVKRRPLTVAKLHVTRAPLEENTECKIA
jgi:hypothetical protein